MSFRISLTPSRRAAARFVAKVRRELQKTLTESGMTQSDIARDIGVHRSVVNRELRGYADITLGRVAELAHAMGRTPIIEFRQPSPHLAANMFETDVGVNVSNDTTELEADQSADFRPSQSTAA